MPIPSGLTFAETAKLESAHATKVWESGVFSDSMPEMLTFVKHREIKEPNVFPFKFADSNGVRGLLYDGFGEYEIDPPAKKIHTYSRKYIGARNKSFKAGAAS